MKGRRRGGGKGGFRETGTTPGYGPENTPSVPMYIHGYSVIDLLCRKVSLMTIHTATNDFAFMIQCDIAEPVMATTYTAHI